jgi:hypothetical protein
MRILLTIFGILVSFILTVQIDKISLDFAFVTWISIIFAVILTGSRYLYIIVESKLKSQEKYTYALDHVHRFYFEAVFILLLLLFFTPFLMIKDDIKMESIDINNVENQSSFIWFIFVLLFLLSISFALLFDILLFRKKGEVSTIVFISMFTAYFISILFSV